MKKSIFFMIFMMVFVLAGCQEPSENGETLTPLNEIAQSITLFNDPLSGDVSLPSTLDGASITWVSLNQTVFSNTGVVTRPEHDEGDLSFTVEATFLRNGESHLESYNVTVRALPFEARDYEAEIDEIVAAWDFINTPQDGRIVWPTTQGDASFNFTSLNPTYLRNDGQVLQPLNSVGDVSAMIEVTFEIEEHTSTRQLSVPIAAKSPLQIVRTNTYDFVSFATEYLVEDSEIELHEMNNGLMFVDLFDFLPLVNGAIVYDELEITVDGNVVDIVLTFEPDDDFPLDYDRYHLTLDFDANTVTVNLFGFFSGIAESTQTDFGAGLDLISYQHDVFDAVVIDLSMYRLELLKHNDQFLMPLDLANLFFTGQMYDVYYNGDRVIGVDTYQLLDRGSDLRRLNNSSRRGSSIPTELRIMTYHYMTFVMDHFYGLRDFYIEDTFYTYLDSLNHNFFADGRSHYIAWFRAVYDLDEPHSSHLTPGYYTDAGEFDLFPAFGPRVSRFRNNYQSLCLFDDNPAEGVMFLDDNTIAMITIDGFNAQTPELMRSYMEQVKAVSSVEDVVLNLACNTGGIIGTAWQVMGHMTDLPLTYQSFNIGDGSQITAQYDTDTVAPDYNWYILTSPATFSAANLVTSMARDMSIATIIGQQSSGGASSITTNILPNGTILIISSASVLANSDFESIELGIPVDVEIPSLQLFDEDAIVSAIRD